MRSYRRGLVRWRRGLKWCASRPPPADVGAIREMGGAGQRAWNARDAKALSALFDAGDRVRHLPAGCPRRGIFLWVLQKQDGTWRILASQNTEAPRVTGPIDGAR